MKTIYFMSKPTGSIHDVYCRRLVIKDEKKGFNGVIIFSIDGVSAGILPERGTHPLIYRHKTLIIERV